METIPITATSRRPAWMRALLAALLLVALGGCNHAGAGGESPGVERESGNGGY